MSRELADITIKFKELEDVTFDVIEEFLKEQNIQYEVINVENRITEYKETEPEAYDIWIDRKMCE